MPHFPALDDASLSEKVYSLIRENILERQLLPGEKIQVEDIARQLGVSGTPIKEALNRLSLEGLVEKIPRHGTFVTRLDAQHVSQVFDARLLLETYAVDRILESGQIQPLLDQLGNCITKMAQAVDGDEYLDFHRFMSWDSNFHLTLMQFGCNSVLFKMYEGLNVHIEISRAHYLRTVTPASQPMGEHRAIYEALESGSREAAREALAAHITHVKQRALDSLASGSGSSAGTTYAPRPDRREPPRRD